MSVTISLTLAQPIPPSATYYDASADVIAYSFSDGRHTIDEMADVSFEFVYTDSEGNVVIAKAQVVSTDDSQQVEIGALDVGIDYGFLTEGEGEDGATSSSVGTWESTIIGPTIPVPALGLPALLTLAGTVVVLGSVVATRARKSGNPRNE